jgi:D-alanyl-D-alanine carboxypeptidase (penicillin-binding protein 5/6)
MRFDLRILLIFFLLSISNISSQTLIPDPPEVNAKSYILVEAHTNEIISEQNADLPSGLASLTKIMTGYVVADQIEKGFISKEDQVLISEVCWRMEGSRMFIQEGKRVSVDDLLKGMIIQSGNDASCALAEHVAGTQGDFAVLMNEYASELGMLDSNFVNPTGLPDVNHYSTARDLAKLSISMINDFPEHYSLYKEKEFTFDDIRQLNRNSLLWQDDSVDGIKTGHTNDSGFCLAGSAIRGETRFVSIVLNSASEKTRIRDTRRLLDYAFRFYQTKTIVKAYEPLTTVDVWAGIDEKVSLGLGSDLKITLQRNKFKNLEFDLPSSLGVRAPISRDQKLDELILLSNGERIQSYDLVAITDVKKKSFISALWDNLIFSFYSFFMQDETT